MAIVTAATLLLFISTVSAGGGNTLINRTVYHLNPYSAGAYPRNMDTGDALGDLYFYLGQFLLPLECENVSPESRAHFDCDNPERVSKDLVVTRVRMTMDSRFTGYSGCNLCNGTDPFSRKPCEVGTYICDCETRSSDPNVCNKHYVGLANVTQMFGPTSTNPTCKSALNQFCAADRHNGTDCEACLKHHALQLHNQSCGEEDFYRYCPSPWNNCNPELPPVVPWGCWASNIPRKTGGYWYSTLKEGEGRSWEVQSLKTINETCLKKTIVASVEKHDTKDCFKGCGPQRNESSSCWIGCFFDTILGPTAKQSTELPLGGMSVADIEKSWSKAFVPEAQGGCPEIK